MSKTAIIFTTFLRNELAADTCNSILEHWIDDSVLLLGDQNRDAHSPHFSCLSEINWYDRVKYFHLPFDCGLSFARNYLVGEAYKLGCEYCLVTADSIAFNQKIDLKPIIRFLEKDPKRGIVGFKLNNRTAWEYNMELTSESFVLTKPTQVIEEEGIKYTKCDICKNFFLAKTKALLEVPWDSKLKLSEHEDHSWRFKQSGYERYVTDVISADYINQKPEEYSIYRNRMYSEFREMLKRKYNISKWVQYK
jgi:GT2 family glycosyltransferase